MSVYNNKANYHPLSNLNGNAPSGSYLLPGTEYYSVDGKAPRLQFEHVSKIGGVERRYSQHRHIDPIHALMQLKQESSLTRYYAHGNDQQAAMCRERYVFVPKALPRQEPNELHHAGLEELKNLAESRDDYKLRDVSKLPDNLSHALPQADLNDDIYRIYEAKYPYDMMVLRDVTRFNPRDSEAYLDASPNHMTSTTIGAMPF